MPAIPKYQVVVSLKNRCGTAIVRRVTSGTLRRIGRTSWATDTESGPALAREGREHALPIIQADLERLGLLPKHPGPHHYT